MNDLASRAGDLVDAFLLWLRVVPWPGVWPTVTIGEAVITPFVLAAWLFRLGTAVDMHLLLRRLRRDGKDEELGASARERLQRSQRGLVRIGCWGVIDWALLTNYEYTLIVFTLGFLLYLLVENVDGALGWKYQLDRKHYWARRDEREDFAERVARRAEAAAARAEEVAARAERRALANVEQGARIEAALAENTALAREAKAHNGRADEHEKEDAHGQQ